MAKKSNYKKYDLWVKSAISMTGSPDLFPELKIPRTTANYWIKQGNSSDDPIVESLTGAINDIWYELTACQGRLAEQEALVKLLKTTVGATGFKLRWKHIDSNEVKFQILDHMAAALVHAPRKMCLELIGLSLSRYKRWRRERRGCAISEIRSCPKGNANQLTFAEIQKMKHLATSKDHSHFPIVSLHYFAKREKILFCSYSTWRKYIDLYKWKRPRKQKRKKERKIGIRAKKPNEIWHLDISYFIMPNKTKYYIQAIIDNYSRYVVAWQVLESYDGSKTGELLKKALRKTIAPKSKHLKLMVDGGGENRSKSVKDLEDEGMFEKIVARFEISFSNSIVETLFRSLKHNYLFHKEIVTMHSLRRHVDFWFTEHNERIPHSSFTGETPLERFKKSWNKKDAIRIFIGQKEAIKLRVKENQKVSCELCEIA
ncbi:MAG: DDE-type integrase/transposase/recombinase [Bdellovibrionales bacterium]